MMPYLPELRNQWFFLLSDLRYLSNLSNLLTKEFLFVITTVITLCEHKK